MVSAENKDIELHFPTVIQVGSLENAAELNPLLLEAVYDLKAKTPNGLPDSWSCDLYTTFGSEDKLQNLAPFKQLAGLVLGKANQFADILKFNTEEFPLEIMTMWVNIYGKGHAQEIHNHANSLISGVYYLKAPPGSPGLLIHNPMADTMLHMPVTETTSINCLINEILVEDGKLVFFRSWMKHSVLPSKIDQDRISIAFNFR